MSDPIRTDAAPDPVRTTVSCCSVPAWTSKLANSAGGAMRTVCAEASWASATQAVAISHRPSPWSRRHRMERDYPDDLTPERASHGASRSAFHYVARLPP